MQTGLWLVGHNCPGDLWEALLWSCSWRKDTCPKRKAERTEEISELGHTMQALCSTWGGHVGVFTRFCLTFSVLHCCNETYYGGTVDIICCICLSNNALICVYSLKWLPQSSLIISLLLQNYLAIFFCWEQLKSTFLKKFRCTKQREYYCPVVH